MIIRYSLSLPHADNVAVAGRAGLAGQSDVRFQPGRPVVRFAVRQAGFLERIGRPLDIEVWVVDKRRATIPESALLVREARHPPSGVPGAAAKTRAICLSCCVGVS